MVEMSAMSMKFVLQPTSCQQAEYTKIHMDQKNPQLNILPLSRLASTLIAVVVTALVVGASIYWWQDVKFTKEVNGLQQTIGKLKEQIIVFGGIPEIDEPTNSVESTKEKILGDYQWDNAIFQTQYQNVLWDKITSDKLAGFSPKTVLTENKTKECEGRDGGSYLRVEGGLCGIGFWLEDSSGVKIDSIEKLTNRFAPVESEAEVVSFIVVTQGDLKIATSGVPEGHVLAITDAFLVQLVNKNTFGCGGHEPTGVIFKISKSGEILKIAKEEERPSDGPISCID